MSESVTPGILQLQSVIQELSKPPQRGITKEAVARANRVVTERRRKLEEFIESRQHGEEDVLA
ncbi:hypothetical protein SAMN02745857_01549 [Andreprevotia lacus DSM 23236]|jgi:division protein CdvB (Snf7/Vps24/ESCRT-III family)|uniref:Uncharacterized protein n=1 Tax=Andreprevotia lacus DSM 23236 TaxID=1121001 RepID=A0A1W1XH67_9NEIS|nr:hypothetical protein [Andreprevotia lacus]SMC23114.1 hypothetical protein SAMN02745857_01549 [Andreprevotia lacus DSM 23236]